jgi:hypothetical protein
MQDEFVRPGVAGDVTATNDPAVHEHEAAAQYLVYGLLVHPGALPGARYAALYYPATVFTGLALIGFVLLLTPTGSLPSPRWRWWARAMVAAPVVLHQHVCLAARSSLIAQRRPRFWAWMAVIATVLTMSATRAPRERSLTGLRSPCRIGPTAIAFADRCTAL